VNNIAHALYFLGQSAPIQALRDDLAELDVTMRIYTRVVDGRNPLLHGSATHSFEHRFITLLVSLIYLRHVAEAAQE
jgi:hypothetical protein